MIDGNMCSPYMLLSYRSVANMWLTYNYFTFATQVILTLLVIIILWVKADINVMMHCIL